ncbi:carbohydrate ABC transporter substrate-binding protein [Arsenicitalea aurantiaca]|uniref:Carbohydrate ABC transporter substrate-binding protein n=1 Tax=Arsenicitalea aurantiaca TaxID=1783274 RepID=A0A433XL49_9HYPH|nr:ABC transporter substrate-binding protein [Arsenicitalea aurantiaca]RUT34781.1 carbohydrate ABC transporter substrate-binding protein [Arsenicitalea aurantiaca]
MAERILKGIAWDHERGHGCLARTADAFTAEHPGIRVEWSVRSLRDFGEGPIDRLADTYDFIVVDHPFSGHAGRSGALIDLRPLFTPEEITALETNAVGKSTISYQFGEAIYAFPTDAAAQIASYRPDLLDRLGSAVPQTHAEVLALAKKARAAGLEIATPACAIDAMCLVLTFAANLGAPLGPDEAEFFTPELLETVLDHVEELVAASDPRSLNWNPIHMYEEMSVADDIVYCPYAFGYSNYARVGRDKPILAANIAGPGADPRAGALLGGAGCAITRSCSDLEAAVAYMRWLHRPEFQAGAYFEAGGQPGLRNAWTDPAVNAAAQGFFADSLETLDKAYLRPRWDGFIPFFEPAGKTINARLKGEITRADTIERLRTLYREARPR